MPIAKVAVGPTRTRCSQQQPDQLHVIEKGLAHALFGGGRKPVAVPGVRC
jgi:hypothetical protein